MLEKNTKPLVLGFTSIFISLQNDLKKKLSIEAYEKG